MPRTRVKTVTWETVVDELASEKTRHIIRRKQNQSPYIKLEDRKTEKTYSLNASYCSGLWSELNLSVSS